jgi:hypothetical protein
MLAHLCAVVAPGLARRGLGEGVSSPKMTALGRKTRPLGVYPLQYSAIICNNCSLAPQRDRPVQRGGWREILTHPPSLKLWRTGRRNGATRIRPPPSSFSLSPSAFVLAFPSPIPAAKCQRTGARAPHILHSTTVMWECNIYFSPEFTADDAGQNPKKSGEMAEEPLSAKCIVRSA